jgi:hypothetical protein
MGGLDLTDCNIVFLFPFERLTCASVSTSLVWATWLSNADRRFLNDSRLCRSQTQRTPDGETKMPRLRSSLETRT